MTSTRSSDRRAYLNPYEWFSSQRGITKETLDAFGVDFRDGDDSFEAIFPYDTGEKRRKVYSDGRREFFSPKGMLPSLFHPVEVPQSKSAFLVEGETDTMRLWQELHVAGKGTAVFGLPGVNTWREHLAEALEPYERVFVVLDNDADYMVIAQVDKAFNRIRDDVGKKIRRIHLPQSVKDICEFFNIYEMETLVDLAGRKGKSRFKPLDLSRPATKPNWLLDNWVAKGDVTLVSGREGLGKSWLTKGLSVAVLEGHDEFIGQRVMSHGRVLYIDQENPEDDVRRRLKKLGLERAVHTGKVRFLHDQNIRLDRDPDTLLDEALDFDPELIIIDSLTRVHTQDENSAGQMAALFNDGIQPLARRTGAAVVLIHHDNKGNDPRGSVDITASPDNILHVVGLDESNADKFILRQGKSRRRRRGDELIIEIKDMPDGTVQLVPDAVITPPF